MLSLSDKVSDKVSDKGSSVTRLKRHAVKERLEKNGKAQTLICSIVNSKDSTGSGSGASCLPVEGPALQKFNLFIQTYITLLMTELGCAMT